MPPRAKPFDLKQVAKLFNDTIAAIQAPENLEPKAIEWLKATRYALMRDIENKYYELEKGLNDPLLLPAWVSPTNSLDLLVGAPIPALLAEYSNAFIDNLLTLLKDCGFQNCSSSPCLPYIWLRIRFPAVVAPAAENAPAVVIPQTLKVDDEFSRLARGAGRGRGDTEDRKPSVGAFTATRFGNLLADARRDTASPAPSASKKRRRDSPTVKEEEEGADQGRRLRSVTLANSSVSARLRSVTRASSTATLRSSVGNGRRRVKRED
ncbi:hypothetical protein B0H11DRAFT_2269245 [Mycena galericulata]|nr:hypothetical protein B0H11DRAFT_2269245 [Mycena galericulata]